MLRFGTLVALTVLGFTCLACEPAPEPTPPTPEEIAADQERMSDIARTIIADEAIRTETLSHVMRMRGKMLADCLEEKDVWSCYRDVDHNFEYIMGSFSDSDQSGLGGGGWWDEDAAKYRACYKTAAGNTEPPNGEDAHAVRFSSALEDCYLTDS